MFNIVNGIMLAGLIAVGSGTTMAAETLRVGNEADFPPFSQKDAAGNVVGFDIDVMNYVCEHMQVECEIVVQEWSGIIPGLFAGKYDVIISSMDINEERKKQVLFTKPYYHGKYSFVARKGTISDVSPEAMEGKTLCMFKNTTPLKWLKETYGDKISISYYDGAQDIKFDLLAGRCDAWLETMPSIYGTLLDTPDGKDFEFVGPVFEDPKYFGEGVGMAARPGDEELIEKLNAAIDAMYADGTFRKINDKYFPFYIGAQ